MAGTKHIPARFKISPGSKIQHLVLTLDERGLVYFLAFLDEHPSLAQVQPEIISIFTAAPDEFSRVNTNADVTGSLVQSEPAACRVLDKGMHV
jgi:hypothetical protein